MVSRSQSSVETRGFTSYWRIENFAFKSDNNFSVESPMFKIKTLKSKWYIEIAEEEEYLGVFLFKATNPTNPMWSFINFSVSLLTGSGWITFPERLNYKFRAYGVGHGVREIVSMKQLKDEEWIYLPNGSLTISVRIWNTRMKTESSQCLMISRLSEENKLNHRPIETFSTLTPNDLLLFPHSYEIGKSRMSNLEDEKSNQLRTQYTQTETDGEYKHEADLLKLFKEKKFTFVTLRTSNRDFSVHKAVLCANSPVFDALFNKEMKENDCNLVDIDDIDSQTLASLVKFLHFEPLGDLQWDAAVTLYYAADKYQIDPLRKECVSVMKKELSVENICDAFILADLHQDKDLTNCAQEYFFKNSKFIFLSKNWKDLLISHPELVAEILHTLAEKM